MFAYVVVEGHLSGLVVVGHDLAKGLSCESLEYTLLQGVRFLELPLWTV